MNTTIGMTEHSRMQVAAELAKLLSDEYVLYTKTRRAHWNVEGADFFAMHQFFEQEYNKIDGFIDEIAERIRTLGHYPPASLSAFLAMTQLAEGTPNGNDSRGFIHQLMLDHETIIVFLRNKIAEFAEAYNDAGSSDFVTRLLQEHEKSAWLFRAHLK